MGKRPFSACGERAFGPVRGSLQFQYRSLRMNLGCRWPRIWQEAASRPVPSALASGLARKRLSPPWSRRQAITPCQSDRIYWYAIAKVAEDDVPLKQWNRPEVDHGVALPDFDALVRQFGPRGCEFGASTPDGRTGGELTISKTAKPTVYIRHPMNSGAHWWIGGYHMTKQYFATRRDVENWLRRKGY